MQNNNADICLLQETHSHEGAERQWCQNWGGDIRFSHGRTGARGIAILIKTNLNYTILDTKKDKDGRIIIIKICIKDTIYVIANIYAPNADNPTFFIELYNLLGNFENNNTIIGGGFQFGTEC